MKVTAFIRDGVALTDFFDTSAGEMSEPGVNLWKEFDRLRVGLLKNVDEEFIRIGIIRRRDQSKVGILANDEMTIDGREGVGGGVEITMKVTSLLAESEIGVKKFTINDGSRLFGIFWSVALCCG